MEHFLDWSPYKDAGMGDAYADIPKHGGDFAKAIAVCINSRQCETENKLVMCPSFKVTGNPNLSTGGRVRMLKAALSNDLTQSALNDATLQEAMDLCVACKGCKRECENNVDMPLIKAEYLAQKAKTQGFSFRSKLLAQTPKWLHGSKLFPVAIKLRNKSVILAKLVEKIVGISASVALPEPVNDTALQTLAHESKEDKPEVVLFVDTFSRHFEPDVVEAAAQVLSASGYGFEVVNAPKGEQPFCCGRTYLAQGMIDQARIEVKRLCEALSPYIKAGKTVIGFEASCVLGLRDDAKAFGLGDLVEKVAEQTFLFEEFLSREIRAKRFDIDFASQSGQPKTLVHGHCHQKAVGAMKAMRRVLKAIPDHDFDIIESGCCGMAGSFGIEAEHAEMASQLAEQGLMPTLRDNPDARVVANGFSCRSQIRAKKDNRPRHLVILLRECLKEQA